MPRKHRSTIRPKNGLSWAEYESLRRIQKVNRNITTKNILMEIFDFKNAEKYLLFKIK